MRAAMARSLSRVGKRAVGGDCRDGTANQHSEAICSKIEGEQDGADPNDSRVAIKNEAGG